MSVNNNSNATPEGQRRLRSGQLYNVQNVTTPLPTANGSHVYSQPVAVSDEAQKPSEGIQIPACGGGEEEEEEEDPFAEAVDDELEVEEEEEQEEEEQADEASEVSIEQGEAYHPTLWEHVVTNIQEEYTMSSWTLHRYVFYHLMMFSLLLPAILVWHDFPVYSNAHLHTGERTQVNLQTFYEDLACCMLICDRIVLIFLGFWDLICLGRDEHSTPRRSWRKFCDPLMFLLSVFTGGFYLVRISQSCATFSTATIDMSIALWLLKTVLDAVECKMIGRGVHVPLSSLALTIITALTCATLLQTAQFQSYHWEPARLHGKVINDTSFTPNTSPTIVVHHEILSHLPTHGPLPKSEDELLSINPAKYLSRRQLNPTKLDDDHTLPQHEVESNTRWEASLSDVRSKPVEPQGKTTRSTMIMKSAARAGSRLLQPSFEERGQWKAGAENTFGVKSTSEVASELSGLAASYLRLKLALESQQRDESTAPLRSSQSDTRKLRMQEIPAEYIAVLQDEALFDGNLFPESAPIQASEEEEEALLAESVWNEPSWKMPIWNDIAGVESLMDEEVYEEQLHTEAALDEPGWGELEWDQRAADELLLDNLVSDDDPVWEGPIQNESQFDESLSYETLWDEPRADKPIVTQAESISRSTLTYHNGRLVSSETNDQTVPTELSEEEIISELEAEFDAVWHTQPVPVGTIRTHRYTGRDGTVTDHLHKMIYYTTINPKDEDIHTVVVYTPQASTVATWKQSRLENKINPINWLRWGQEWIQSHAITTRDAYEDEIYSIKRAEAISAAAATASSEASRK